MSTPIRVLHVDDDYSFLTVSKSILEEDAFAVDTTTSAEEALLKLKNENYEVIISDYEMPLKNGLDLLKEIRASGMDIPFILFTGKGREEIVVQALNLGTDRYIDKHGDPVVVFTELSTSIRQLCEKSHAKRKLWESEERFKKMVTNSKDLIMLTGTDGSILYLSPSCKEILGYEPDELIGERPWVIHPDDSERAQKTLQKALTEPASGEIEYRISTKQGKTKWLHHSYSQIIDNGKISQIVSVITDITEPKKAEIKVKESEEKFSAAFHSSGAAISFSRVHDGLIIDANECCLKLFGYTREEMIGKTSNELGLYANSKARAEIVKLALNSQPIINIELQGRRKDRAIITCLFSAKIVNIREEKYFLTTLIDVSDLKKTQETLSLKQKQFQDFMGMIPNAVAITDLTGKFVYCNDLLGKTLGVSPHEVIGRYTTDFVIESDAEDMLSAFRELTNTTHTIFKTFHCKRKNEVFLVDGSGKAMRDEFGKVTGFVIMIKDITDKATKEEKNIELLKESEKREANIKDLLVLSEVILRNSDIETSLENILITFKKIFDVQLGIITLLQNEEIPGITIHSVGEKTFKQVHRTPNMLIQFCKKTCLNNQPVFINNLENSKFANAIKKMPYPLPNNAIIVPLKMKDQLAGFTLLANKKGKFNNIDLTSAAMLAGFAQIALENNAATEAVANSEKQLRVITDSAKDAIIMLDSNATVSFWSPAAEKMFEYRFEEIRGKDFHKIFAPSHYIPAYEKGFADFVKTGQGLAVGKTLELTAKRKSGEEFPIELSLSTLKAGASWKAVGIVRDISERKENEQKLQESEERYRFIAEHANDIITITDVNGVFKYVSPSMKRVTGIEQSQLIGKKSVLEFLNPEIINNFNPKMAQLVQTGELPPLEFKLDTPNGIIWLETNVNIVHDESGQITFNAISRDITQRKNIEEELRESEARYRFVADFAQDLITVTDLQENYQYVSPSVKHLLGYTPEELVEKARVLDYFHPEDVDNFKEHIRKLLVQKDLPPVEFRFLTKSGHYVWLEAKISPVQETSGNTKFISISRDVTQRNKDREALDKALSQAELSLEKLGVIGGFVRHDVRNKLTNINNVLYLSKKHTNENPEMLLQIGRINAAVKSIVRILEFSQTYEALGSQGLSWIKVDDSIQGAQLLFSGVKDLKIETKELNYEVIADSALTEIFHNLIDNSIKYGGQNLPQIKVHAEIAANQNLRLIYEDTGKGIDSSIKPKLFQKGAGKGTGLGLYLIGRICAVYGWTVKEEGEPGKGVRFVLEIPQENMRQK